MMKATFEEKYKNKEGETDRKKVQRKLLMGQMGREVMRVPRGAFSLHVLSYTAGFPHSHFSHSNSIVSTSPCSKSSLVIPAEEC